MKKIIKLIILAPLLLGLSMNVSAAHDYAMSYLYGGTTTQYMKYLESAGNVLNTVSPDYFDISQSGTLDYSKVDGKFITEMHSKNIKVIPFLSNHWDKPSGIKALENTEGLTDEIAAIVKQYNIDGVNVDIENVSHVQRDAYTNFVKTLRRKLPDKIIAVSVAANPNNWQVGWHGSYDYAGLAQHSDYLMIMGYDESFYGSAAGPVASSSFAEKSILYALNYTAPDKLVLGIPFYGRFWKEGETVGGNGITSMDIKNLIKNYQTTQTYHEDKQSAQVFLTLKPTDVMPKLWGGKTLNAGKYEIWYDDINSVRYKLELVDKYGLKGSGSWALGQDDTEIWAQYANFKTSLATPAPTPEPARTPSPDNEPAVTQPPHQEQLTGKQTGNKVTRSWSSEEMYDENTGLTRVETITIKISEGKGSQAAEADESGAPRRLFDINAGNRTQSGAAEYSGTETITFGGAGSHSTTAEEGGTGAAAMSGFATAYSSDMHSNSGQGESSYGVKRGWFTGEQYNERDILTRSEAIKIIMHMAGNLPAPSDTVSHFKDTVRHADAEHILKAKYYGIIEGDKFNPDEAITKEDLILYMDKVFNLPETVNFENGKVRDIDRKRNYELYCAVNKYLEHGIITVDANGSFNPSGFITKGEMAQIVNNMKGIGIKELQHGRKPSTRYLEPR